MNGRSRGLSVLLRRLRRLRSPVAIVFSFLPQGPLLTRHLVEILVFLEEVGDVEKRIAFQAEIDERRLHAWQDAGHAPFMDTACEGILVGALEINLNQLIILDQRYSGLVPVGRDHQFLTHPCLPPRVGREVTDGTGHATRLGP